MYDKVRRVIKCILCIEIFRGDTWNFNARILLEFYLDHSIL